MNVLKAIVGLLMNRQTPTVPVISKPAPSLGTLTPVFVRVPNGFPIPARTNGASRRRKSNRLHLSRNTRNKNRQFAH